MKLRCHGIISGIQGEMNYEGFLLSGFSGTCAWKCFQVLMGAPSLNSLYMLKSTDWFYWVVLKAVSKNKSWSLSRDLRNADGEFAA